MGNCQNASLADNTKTLKTDKRKPENLAVETRTWDRDSHGLFDYENENSSKGLFRILQGARFVRAGQVVTMKPEEVVKEDNEHEILNIRYQNGQYWILPENNRAPPKGPAPDPESIENYPWVVVKSLKKTPAFPKGYKLKEGDILKLGRVRFRVKEMKIDGIEMGAGAQKAKTEAAKQKKQPIGKKAPTDAPKLPSANILENKSKTTADPNKQLTVAAGGENLEKSTVGACRICYDEADEADDNPVVTPCSCTGSVQYIHIKCLQKWLKSRLQMKQTQVALTVVWKNLDCEICKKPFPKNVNFNGVRLPTLELPKPDSNSYIVLEVISKDRSQIKGLHIINMGAKNMVKLGRGHDSDVRIPDISVSRFHASIQLDKGGYYINDNDSKFGTLVMLKKSFAVRQELNAIQMQVGRTVLSFTLSAAPAGHKQTLTSCMVPEHSVIDLNAGDRIEKLNATGDHELDFNDGANLTEVEEDQQVLQGEENPPAGQNSPRPSPRHSPRHSPRARRDGPGNQTPRSDRLEGGDNQPEPQEPLNIEDFLYDNGNGANDLEEEGVANNVNHE